MPTVRLYGDVSDSSDLVIDWCPDPEEAHTVLRDYLANEPEHKDDLFVWPFEFEASPN
jgi:hypothetical protein